MTPDLPDSLPHGLNHVRLSQVTWQKQYLLRVVPVQAFQGLYIAGTDGQEMTLGQ
ncbi:hypothetical protein D3C87_2107510 [compost metagenome]